MFGRLTRAVSADDSEKQEVEGSNPGVDDSKKNFGERVRSEADVTSMGETDDAERSKFSFVDVTGQLRESTGNSILRNSPLVIPTDPDNLTWFDDDDGISPPEGATCDLNQAFPEAEGKRDDEESRGHVTFLMGEMGSGRGVVTSALNARNRRDPQLFSVLLDCGGDDEVNDAQVKLADLVMAASGFPSSPPGGSPTSESSSRAFGLWLHRHQRSCRFILRHVTRDVIEAASSSSSSPDRVTVDTRLTRGEWLALVIGRRIMRRSRVLVTCQPSALLALPAHFRRRRDFRFRRLGPLAPSNLAAACRCYGNAGAEAARLLASGLPLAPFVVATACLTSGGCHGDEEESDTWLLSRAMDLMIRRRQNGRRNAGVDSEGKASAAVDRLMFEMLERRLAEISEREMMTSYGVSLSEVEELTTVVVRRMGDDVIVKPKYDVIQDFHAARHVMRGAMETCAFKRVVEERLFRNTAVTSSDDATEEQDSAARRWGRVRRMACGLVDVSKFDEDKSTFFLYVLVLHLKNSTSQLLADKFAHDERKFESALEFQTSLYNDLMELNAASLQVVSSILANSSAPRNLELSLPHRDPLLRGVARLFRTLDPRLDHVTLTFRSRDAARRAEQLGNFVRAFASLTANVTTVTLNRVGVDLIRSGEAVGKLMMKVDLILQINLDEACDVTGHQGGDVIAEAVQSRVDAFAFTRSVVQLNGRNGNARIIRHRSYHAPGQPDDVLSVIKPSHFGGNRITANLAKLSRDEVMSKIATLVADSEFVFDFVVASSVELRTLCSLVSRSGGDLRLRRIYLYLTRDVEANDVTLFCTSLHGLKRKVEQVVVYNARHLVLGVDQLKSIYERTSENLMVSYLDTLPADNGQQKKFGTAVRNFVEQKPCSVSFEVYFRNFKFVSPKPE